MRIIAGNYKGKKIFFPKTKHTRPLRDLVKESIFNLIENSNKFNIKIKDSNVLDLFSGSGSFGLECISREAKKVTFVENYFETLKILKKNIIILKCEKKCILIEKDCFKYFETNFENKEKIDIVFLDPPFREKKINLLINHILEHKLLTKNGIIITHRHKKDNLELTNKLKIIDQRLYGISRIIIGN